MLNDDKKPEYFTELRQEALTCAEKSGIEKEKAVTFVDNLSTQIFKRWSGLTIYFKKSVFCDLETRNQKIIADYHNGLTLKQLSQKFNLTTQGIYRILKDSEVQVVKEKKCDKTIDLFEG